MRQARENTTTEGLMTARRLWFALLVVTALAVGYVGIWQYVHTERGSVYGTNRGISPTTTCNCSC